MNTTTVPQTMRALLQRGYGSTEQLATEQRPVPAPRAGQVLVRVEAVSPDSGTLHLLHGSPLAVRAALGLTRPRQPIIGLAFAGRVVAVGPAGSGRAAAAPSFAVGNAVAGSAPAAFAEYVVASPAKLALVPAGVSMTDAAALPISAGTALQALRDAGRLEAGQRVLIIGAGGGVGAFLTQLAVAAGARVTGVASARKREFVRSLGAEAVIDYRAVTDPADWGRFDLVVDTADGRPLHVLRRAVAPRGTLVIVGADGAGGPLLDGADRQLRALLVNPWVRQRVVPMMQKESGADLATLLGDVAAGRIGAAVEEVVPFARATEAIARLERQEVRGKIVIAID